MEVTSKRTREQVNMGDRTSSVNREERRVER